MEQFFVEGMRHNDVMQYDYAEVDGNQIFYSRAFAFDSEKAENQEQLVVMALLKDGNLKAFSHIKDMNEYFDLGQDYITKEKLEKNKGDIFENMELYRCDTPESKGNFVFYSMHSNLVKWHSERSKK